MMNIIKKLSEKDSITITNIIADVINRYCENKAKVKVSRSGDTSISINLDAGEIKYIMTQIYNSLT